MTHTSSSNVRVRMSSPDPFNGLRGHAYIKARGLSLHIPMKGVPMVHAECQCALCVRERLLPAVQRICAVPDRRQPTNLQEIPWNDLTNELAHDLLDAPTVIGG